jgi:uncharacterized protein (TIGR00730 family)
MTRSPIDPFDGATGGPRLSICVFCGARPGFGPAPMLVAEQTGTLIGRRGHRLVYGAGGSGLMGEVARAAMAGGAHVTGIVPRFLYELERVRGSAKDELILTDDMFERKRLMISGSDAFIALPGGYGTLDEVLEVISLAYLDQCAKPLALVDTGGRWGGLLSLFDDLLEGGFTRPDPGLPFRVVDSAREAIEFVERHAPAPVPDAVEV